MAQTQKADATRAGNSPSSPRYLFIREKPRLDVVYVSSRRLPCNGAYNKELAQFLSTISKSSRLMINVPKNMAYPRPFGAIDYISQAYVSFPNPDGIIHMEDKRDDHFKCLVVLGFSPGAIAVLSVLSHLLEARYAGMPGDLLHTEAYSAIRAMKDSSSVLSQIDVPTQTAHLFTLSRTLEASFPQYGGDAAACVADFFESYSGNLESILSNARTVRSLLDNGDAESTCLVFPSFLDSGLYKTFMNNIWNSAIGGKSPSLPSWAKSIANAPTEDGRRILQFASDVLGMK